MQRHKFGVAPLMDFSLKIRRIVDTSHCKKHNKRIGQPCWWVQSDGASVLLAGICNSRISAVYNGKIDDRSIQASRSKKERS